MKNYADLLILLVGTSWYSNISFIKNFIFHERLIKENLGFWCSEVTYLLAEGYLDCSDGL